MTKEDKHLSIKVAKILRKHYGSVIGQAVDQLVKSHKEYVLVKEK